MHGTRDANGDGNGLLADALIGAAAGAAAVWFMDRVDWFNFEHEDPQARRRTQAVRRGGMDPAHTAAHSAAEGLNFNLEPKQQNPIGLATHYSLGVIPGALYGMLRHKVPSLDAGRGTLFGLGLFAIQDEGINALTGLSAKPQEYPWQAHARGFVAHVAYGLVLDTILDVANGLLGSERSHKGHPAAQRSQDDANLLLSH